MEISKVNSKVKLKFILIIFLLLMVNIVLAQTTPTLSGSAGCSPTRVDLSWTSVTGATHYWGYRCSGVGCVPYPCSTVSCSSPSSSFSGTTTSYKDQSVSSGTVYRYQVVPNTGPGGNPDAPPYRIPGKLSNIVEVTVPSCCVPEQGQDCGSCGGTIKCDGTCSIPTPTNFGQECNCAPCGCGGSILCDGACSASTPSCPTPDQLIYKLDMRNGDCGKTIGGKLVSCEITGNDGWIYCFSGDKRITCRDTGYGRDHGCDIDAKSGNNGCHAFERKNNQGEEACEITCEKKEGCYDKNGNFANPGTLARDNFGSYYPWGGAAQTDPDQSSQACGCLLVKDWNDAGKCCGDDTNDCGKITSGMLCNIDKTFSSAKWVSASENKGDIEYAGCSDAEYLSDGTSWTKCDGTFLRLSVEGNEYICIGKGKETLVECCGDGDCNSDETDGKRLTTGKSIIK